ncbi:MAG: radical SAM protein [Gracilibacteraceae bacterium]|nr:radical SAM protein [Gracilibacteraceae bacterium]
MNIARILYPVKTLGPGNRVGIWVCGCPRRCRGCANPELWERRPEFEITVDRLREVISGITAGRQVDGFTVSGGEPMAQPEDLEALVRYLGTVSKDIIVYSGFEYAELMKQDSEVIQSVLASIAVLIDGRYAEELNKDIVLRGSENQNVIILNERFRAKYENYLKITRNQIQNFTTADGVVSVGIHNKDFKSKISSKIRGVLENG